jgi:FkbM family methyltransferase
MNADLIELKSLLDEPLSAVRVREHKAFEAAIAPHRRVVLFGAGTLGRKILSELRKTPVEVCCLSDNNSSLWGKQADGIDVLAPRDAAERFGKRAAFVVTIWNYSHSFDESRKSLRSLGCEFVVPACPVLTVNSGSLFPHYSLDWPHSIITEAPAALRAFDLWADDLSRAAYVAFIRSRLQMNFDGLPPLVEHYPTDLIKPAATDVFVDCGAYTGDTIADFLQRRQNSFKHVIGIEPDPHNFAVMADFVNSLPPEIAHKITVVNAAASDRRGTAEFLSLGTMASALADNMTPAAAAKTVVNCMPLDDIVGDVKPSFVKVDVEGSELLVLRGARRLLENAASVWGVTTEHRQSDLWEIPLFIRSVCDGYRYYLRPHYFEGWDLVCYAVPK